MQTGFQGSQGRTPRPFSGHETCITATTSSALYAAEDMAAQTADRPAIQAAILYTASRLEAPTFHTVSKVFYFADRLHLGRYGALMFGDSYAAMKHGPVPTVAYELMRRARRSPGAARELGFGVKEIPVNGWQAPMIVPLAAPDLDELSDAAVSCLEEAIRDYGSLHFHALTEASHDAAWNAVGPDEQMPAEDIAATLPNAAAVLEHLRNPHPDV